MTKVLITNIRGEDGDDGKSAYQLAVDAGFVGTEAEWLVSLEGEKGDIAGPAEIAAAQGYWPIYSATPPTQTTMYGVPVVWIDSTSVIPPVPVNPAVPTWTDATSKFTVPAAQTGLDYYWTAGGGGSGQKLTPGAVLSTSGTFPRSVIITPVAKPGYVLAAGVRPFLHDFPDPAAVTVLTSDTFAGPNKPSRSGVSITTNSTTTITGAAGTFTSADIGATISATGVPVGTYITAVASDTSATLSATATASGTVTATFTNNTLIGQSTNAALGGSALAWLNGLAAPPRPQTASAASSDTLQNVGGVLQFTNATRGDNSIWLHTPETQNLRVEFDLIGPLEATRSFRIGIGRRYDPSVGTNDSLRYSYAVLELRSGRVQVYTPNPAGSDVTVFTVNETASAGAWKIQLYIDTLTITRPDGLVRQFDLSDASTYRISSKEVRTSQYLSMGTRVSISQDSGGTAPIQLLDNLKISKVGF